MELARRNITLHRLDKSYRLLLVERDDILEEFNLEYGKIVINTEKLTYSSLLTKFIEAFTMLGDTEEEAEEEAEILLEFCTTNRMRLNEG